LNAVHDKGFKAAKATKNLHLINHEVMTCTALILYYSNIQQQYNKDETQSGYICR